MKKSDWKNIEIDEEYRDMAEILIEIKGNCSSVAYDLICSDCPFEYVCCHGYTDEETYADAKEYLRRLDEVKE